MGAPTWPKLPAVIEDLLADASQYQLFQALSILETLWSERGTLGAGLDEWVRIRPAPELGFPASALRACTLAPDGSLQMRANVFGLYGVDAPMPLYFLDRATADDEGAARLRAFLDIFNHRLYALMYQAWRLEQPLAERPDSVYRAHLDAISGSLGSAAQGASGVGSRRVRSAAGLRSLLNALLPGHAVSVHDRLPQWVRVASDAALGQGMSLGGECLLGDAVVVAGGRLRVEIGTLSAEEAQALLPQCEDGRRLLAAIRRYLDGSCAFDLLLQVRARASRGCSLGEAGLRLGWSSWLGDEFEQAYEIHISGEQLESGATAAGLPPALADAA